jgi:hypothetical protein
MNGFDQTKTITSGLFSMQFFAFFKYHFFWALRQCQWHKSFSVFHSATSFLVVRAGMEKAVTVDWLSLAG